MTAPTRGTNAAEGDVRGAPPLLDLRGLLCPLPVLRAHRALRAMPGGAEVCVLASDPAAPQDFQRFCEQTGHVLVSQQEDAGTFKFVIRKAAT